MAGYGASRFDEMNAFGSGYTTPGWQRAQTRRGKGGFDESGQPYGQTGRQGGPGARYVADPEFVDDGEEPGAGDEAGSGHLSPRGRGRTRGARSGEGAKKRRPLTIEGELVAKSTGAESHFGVGDRVFHQKFGNGNVTAVDGNKLTIRFDKAGEKRVVDSFVERV
jgi:ATP-dependent DNA helicase UvrD/PcrA